MEPQTTEEKVTEFWETWDLSGWGALAVSGKLVLYEMSCESPATQVFKFVFEQPSSPPPPSPSSYDTVQCIPQNWTKSIMSAEQATAEVLHVFRQEGAVDVTLFLKGDLDALNKLEILAQVPSMAPQLFMHQWWHRKNLVKSQCIFSGTHGTTMPHPVSSIKTSSVKE